MPIPPLKGVREMLSLRYRCPMCQKNIPLTPFKGGTDASGLQRWNSLRNLFFMCPRISRHIVSLRCHSFGSVHWRPQVRD